MPSNSDQALSALGFTNSLGINVHMEYTDGAYASEANVASDLAYLGITNIRDGVPTGTSIPTLNQITALNQLAAAGIKFDLGVSNTNVATQMAALNALEATSPGSIIAVEGPNEINNWPVTYNGLTGQAAAVAFQTALYSAVKSDPALAGASVYNFTGGTTPIETTAGTLVANANGSYTLTNGVTGWHASLPVGVTTITATYTGSGAAPWGGIYWSPGNGQQGALTGGKNGVVSFTYDNTGTAPLGVYISFSDWNSSTTITGLTATNGNSGNLVTFDPNMSLAGMADDSNSHPYPSNGAEPGSYMHSTLGLPVPGPRVITEDGYNTDPNNANGVSQTVQAQDEVKILLDGYQAGVAQTYLYELLDEKPDPNNTNSEMHFGVFNNDNSPKLAAVAIHNLTSLLNANNAPVAGFTPGTLAWSATGLPTTANTMLLEKTNGAFDLAVWNEPATATTGAAAVTVSLGATYGTVEVFDPVTGSAPIQTLTNVSQVNLSLGLDPLVIEVEPTAAATAAIKAAAAKVAAVKTASTLSPTKMAFVTPAATAATAAGWSASATSATTHFAAALPSTTGSASIVTTVQTTTPASASLGFITQDSTQALAGTHLAAIKAAHQLFH